MGSTRAATVAGDPIWGPNSKSIPDRRFLRNSRAAVLDFSWQTDKNTLCVFDGVSHPGAGAMLSRPEGSRFGRAARGGCSAVRPAPSQWERQRSRNSLHLTSCFGKDTLVYAFLYFSPFGGGSFSSSFFLFFFCLSFCHSLVLSQWQQQ